METRTNVKDSKINSISNEGDVLIWDRQGIEPDMDYGLNVLPCQERVDEEKPIELQINKEGLMKEELEEIECFLEAHKDLFSKHHGDLGDTNLITHKIDVVGAKPVKSRPNRVS